MAGILDSLFGDLQGTSAGGLLGLLGGGGGIGTATRRLRTPEEEQQAAALYGGNLNLPSQIPTGFSAGTPQASPQDYVGTPGALDPKWQALLAGNTDPYQPNAQLPSTATPTVGAQNGPGVTLPQLGDSGFGRDTGPQNPLMGLLGGIGNLFGASSAQAAPAPGAAQQPGIPAQAAAGPAAGPGLFGRLQAGATNLSSGGNPLAGLINAVGGLATGERTDRQGIALQNQAATQRAYEQSLVANGIPLQQARPLAQAASVNPEAAKTLAPYLLTKPTWGIIGQDVLGHNQYGWTNPLNQSVTAPNVTGPGVGAGVGGGGLPQNIDPQVWGQMSPDERLAKMPPSVQGELKAIREGRQSATGRNIQTLLPLVNQVWPDFTMTDYKAIQNARTAWSTGPDAGAVKSLNQAINHGDQAWKLIDKFPNLNVGGPIGRAINTPYTALVAATKPQYASDVQEYQKLTEALAGELRTASAGSGHGSIEQIRAWKEGADAAASPAEMRGSIRGAMDFLHGAAEALATKKTAAFRSQEQIKADELLEPERKKQFERIRNSTEGGPQPSQQTQVQPAIPPPAQRQVGQTYPTPKGPAIWRGTGWELVK